MAKKTSKKKSTKKDEVAETAIKESVADIPFHQIPQENNLDVPFYQVPQQDVTSDEE